MLKLSMTMRDDKKAFDLLVKYTNITLICILSTFAGGILVIISNIYILATIDTGINSGSVVLLLAKYSKIYKKLCGCCDKCFVAILQCQISIRSNMIIMMNGMNHN